MLLLFWYLGFINNEYRITKNDGKKFGIRLVIIYMFFALFISLNFYLLRNVLPYDITKCIGGALDQFVNN